MGSVTSIGEKWGSLSGEQSRSSSKVKHGVAVGLGNSQPGVSPREFKTMYTQKLAHNVYSSLTHNSQRMATRPTRPSRWMHQRQGQWNTHPVAYYSATERGEVRHSAARVAVGTVRRVKDARRERHLVCDPTVPRRRSGQRGPSTEAGAGLIVAGRGRRRTGGTANGCGASLERWTCSGIRCW